jgi:segregation and condensation protein A
MNQETLPQIQTEFSGYPVKLDSFQGPLDLLLYLIRQEKIDIYDIPIAQITRQYLEYIEMMEKLDLELAGEFILMAATLIRIKVKLLLPPVPGEEEDPRIELVQALLEHERFQKAASDLASLEQRQASFHSRADFSFLPLAEPVVELKLPTLFDLLTTYKSLLEKQTKEIVHAVELPQVSLEERIEHVLSLLEDHQRVGFEELCQDVPLKIYAIVTLLALLELTRRGWTGFEQNYLFGPISLWRIRN